MKLATSAGARAAMPRTVFRPGTKLDTSQVHDLRRTAPLPSASNPGGTRPKREQSVKAGHKPRPLKSAARNPVLRTRPDLTSNTTPAPRLLPRKFRAGPRDYLADLQKSGQFASVVRALTAQVPGAGAPIPIPIPARVALALGSYFMGESFMRPASKKRLGPVLSKR